MNAVMHLKVQPMKPIVIRETAKRPGLAGRFNRALSRFANFQNDEKLIEMDSPYRWMQ